MAYPTINIYILRHNLRVQETGSEMHCLRYLQDAQPYSSIWAMKVNNWSMDERTLEQKDYPRRCDCCGLPFEQGYVFAAGENYAFELSGCLFQIARD